MHHTERRKAVVRIGEELRNRGWTLFGYTEDRSDIRIDYYAPASWDGVATHADHLAIVVCVDTAGITVEWHSGKDGWPVFQANPKGRTWHVERDGQIARTGMGLKKCASSDRQTWQPAVRQLVDEIEAAAFAQPSDAGTTIAASSDGNTVSIQHERDWTWVFFSLKPAQDVRTRLKAMGSRWGRKRQGWYFRRNVPHEELAWLLPEINETPKGEDTVPLVLDDEGMDADPTGYEPGKGDAYDYIPKWMNVPGLYETEKQDDPLAVIKLFTPDSNWTWFITEYDGEDTAFGLVVGFESEFGHFSLSEIQAAKGPMGLQVERDLWFRPTPVSQLPEYEAKWGNDGPYRGSIPAFTKQLTGESVRPAHDGAAGALLAEVAAIVPEISGIGDAQPTMLELPEGWTVEDIAFLLEKLEGGPILVADTELGIPTIHNTGGRIEHCGFGLMRAEGTGFTLHFDAGSAMKRTPSGKGWTRLKVEGQYAYDMEGVKATLQAYLDSATTDNGEGKVERHPLTFGDNGGQVFFEGEKYLLLNPYLEREGKRYATGWTWHYRNGSTGNEWRCLPDPDAGPDTCIGAFSLKEAVAYAERVTGLHFNLVETPADLPDSYPIHEMWKEHQARVESVEAKAEVTRMCVGSCGEEIPPDEHTHECAKCGATLCTSASPRCRACDAEGEAETELQETSREPTPIEEWDKSWEDCSPTLNTTCSRCGGSPAGEGEKHWLRACGEHIYLCPKCLDALLAWKEKHIQAAKEENQARDREMRRARAQARKARTEVRPSVCDNASRGPNGWKGGVSPTPGGVSITPQCLDSPAARVVTVYYDEYMDDGEHDTMNLCDECYRILRKEARAHGYKLRGKKLSAARPKAKAKAKEPIIQVVEPVPPPAQAEATKWEPTPEDEAEFKQWSLELLTGMMKKRKSAFYRALDAVARPGALRLVLIEIPAAEARRRELIEKRLAKLAA